MLEPGSRYVLRFMVVRISRRREIYGSRLLYTGRASPSQRYETLKIVVTRYGL